MNHPGVVVERGGKSVFGIELRILGGKKRRAFELGTARRLKKIWSCAGGDAFQKRKRWVLCNT